jgi:hypothetical protein
MYEEGGSILEDYDRTVLRFASKGGRGSSLHQAYVCRCYSTHGFRVVESVTDSRLFITLYKPQGLLATIANKTPNKTQLLII